MDIWTVKAAPATCTEDPTQPAVTVDEYARERTASSKEKEGVRIRHQ